MVEKFEEKEGGEKEKEKEVEVEVVEVVVASKKRKANNEAAVALPVSKTVVDLTTTGTGENAAVKKEPKYKPVPAKDLLYENLQLVEGRWQGDKLWFPATVLSGPTEGNKYNLAYEDGDEEREVQAKFIRLRREGKKTGAKKKKKKKKKGI